MTGLTPGTDYTFTVTASNAAGKGTATRAQATHAAVRDRDLQQRARR